MFMWKVVLPLKWFHAEERGIKRVKQYYGWLLTIHYLKLKSLAFKWFRSFIQCGIRREKKNS